MRADVTGDPYQGFWSPEERSKAVAFRELRASTRLAILACGQCADRGEVTVSGCAAEAAEGYIGRPRWSPENGRRLSLFKTFAYSARGGRARRIWCYIDDFEVVYIIRAMVTASRELTPGLRILQNKIESQGLELNLQWISSAENRYTNCLSRRLDPTAPQSTRSVIDLLSASLSTMLGTLAVLRHRLNGGEHPVGKRKKFSRRENGNSDGREVAGRRSLL